MSDQDGWQPLSTPARRAGADAFHLSPFARLARAHSFASVGDALVTIALAGSLFFDVDPKAARWKVLLYLVLTVAPLALVAPFIGPVLDRSKGGRRWMIIAVNGIRAAVCFVMLGDLKSLLLYPEAFTVLAMGKAYALARSAVVPTVVRNDAELVEANSKLQLLSGLAAPGAGILAGPAYAIAGANGVLGVAMVAYLVATLAAIRIPRTQVAVLPVSAEEAAELRSVGIFLAASAMGLIRGIVGFLTFLLIFGLRYDTTWHLGFVLAFTGGGALVGSAVAPRLRAAMTEERMLEVVLGLTVVVGLLTAWAVRNTPWAGEHDERGFGGLAAAAALSGTVAIVSTCGKLAFDSLVQRDAPDANRGRSFARFEVRFQLVWVIAAMLPLLLLPIRPWIGFLTIALTAGFALVSYVLGQRTARSSPPPVPMDYDDATLVDRQGYDTGSVPTIYDGGAEGDFDLPAAEPAVERAPRFPEPAPEAAPDDLGDLASWQVSDPAWGEDRTAVHPDRTIVQSDDGDEDPTVIG